ncbi:uncharacterized protein [Epargyreus clarus]|uniref:uncharacterized protein n=1 Tax=Epargyreus clarus TaxID=520877 RepID=UPI003C2ADBED
MNGKKRKILDTREIESYERDRPATSFSREPQIKLEPRDVGLRSPQQEMSPRNPYYQEYPPWNMAGPSVGSFQYGQLTGGPLPSMGMAGLAPSPGMAGLAPSPGMAGLAPSPAQSPGLRGLSPGMQAQSPLMQAASPIMQVDSPHMQAPSPNMQAQSPHMQAPSPHLQAPSPHGQVPSPHMQAATHMQAQCQPMHMLAQPSGSHVDLISSIVMQQPMLQQQQQQQQQQPQLQEAAAASGELSTLSGLLAFLERAPDLSDSLNRLSTSDLYQ